MLFRSVILLEINVLVSRRMTVLPGFAVPVITNCVSSVTICVAFRSNGPLIEPASSMIAVITGIVSGMVSIEYGGDASLTFPAASVAVAVNEYCPLGNGFVSVMLQIPSALAVVVAIGAVLLPL